MKNKIITLNDDCLINFNYVCRIWKDGLNILIQYVNGGITTYNCDDEQETEMCFDLYRNIMSHKHYIRYLKKYNKWYDLHSKEVSNGK